MEPLKINERCSTSHSRTLRQTPVNSLLLRGHFTRYLRALLPQSHSILSTNQRTCMVKLRKNILIFNNLQMGNSKYFQKTLKSRSLTSFFFIFVVAYGHALYCFVLYSLGYCDSGLLNFIKRIKAGHFIQYPLQNHSGIKTTNLKSTNIPR